MALVEFHTFEEAQDWIDKNIGTTREYTVLVHRQDGDAVAFPLMAMNEQLAYKQFDSMYMSLNNTGQVYPYGVAGGGMTEKFTDAVRIELLDYLTDATLASYSVVR